MMPKKDKFLINNIIMFFGTSVVNVANLLYQVLVVRKLTIASYGAFNSLLSIFTVVSLPIVSLTAMIAKFVPYYNHLGEQKKANLFLFVLLKHMGVIAAIFLSVSLLFGLNVKNYLQLDSSMPVYFTGGILFLSIISIVVFGGLQGYENFLYLSIYNGFGSVLKLLLAFLFISLGWELLGVLGAYIIAQIASLGVGFFVLREIFYVKDTPLSDLDLRQKYKFAIPSLITFGCTAFLTNIDIILVKHFFDPILAGYYSVAQLIGKMVFFIPGAIYTVMFPHAAGLHAQNKDSRFLLLKSLGYTVLLCLCVVLAYNIFPEVFLKILTGKVNLEIIFLGRLFSIAMIFFSLLSVLLLYQLSVSKFMFLKSLVLFSMLQVLAILIFHAALSQVLFILLVNSLVLFVINLRSSLKGS
ncbi:MAG: oligosaccharide flippase family protein [Candidatus Omnitrophica bacterium]|nr:oligosaccharide flippase family protein [Candidatus Omnitrophota bacterium]